MIESSLKPAGRDAAGGQLRGTDYCCQLRLASVMNAGTSALGGSCAGAVSIDCGRERYPTANTTNRYAGTLSDLRVPEEAKVPSREVERGAPRCDAEAG